MGTLPSQKRILREDLKEAPKWIIKLITPLNSFMETVYSTLNRNVTFNENIACQIQDVEFTISNNYPTTFTTNGTLSFSKSIRTKGIGVIILQVVDKTSGLVITNGVTADWTELNGKIIIRHISGLAQDKKYSVRLLVI